MRNPWNDAELVRRFRSQARTALPRAPLNSALSAAIANDRSLHTLLGHAPATQQQPVFLLATIHFLLLSTERYNWLEDASAAPAAAAAAPAASAPAAT